MFGTVARIRPKPGGIQALLDMSHEFDREHATRVTGYVADYIFESEKHPGEYILVAIFEDRESYMANADSPEQDAFYRRFRQHLTEDPIWEDGEIIYASHGSTMPTWDDASGMMGTEPASPE
jgi:quinol monooxygenase YgiN